MDHSELNRTWLAVPGGPLTPAHVRGGQWFEARWDNAAAAPLVLGHTVTDEALSFVLRRGARRQFLYLPPEVKAVSLHDLSPPGVLRLRRTSALRAYLGGCQDQLAVGNLQKRCGTFLRLVAAGSLREVWRRAVRATAATPSVSPHESSLKRPKKFPKSMLPLRTAFISHSMAIQGAPLSLLELATGLRDQGVVEPILIGPDSGPLVGLAHEVGIRVLTQPIRKGARLTAGGMRLQVQALSSLMTAERMQLVYANTLHGFPSIRAAAESEIPSVWIIRESEPWWAAFDGYSDDVRSIAWKACEQAERIVFVADATRRLWGDRIAQERAVTIPNRLRVDPAARAPTKEAARAFLGIGMEECVILNIGELSRLKGQADLVKAFGKLHTSLVQQSRLIFLGNGVRDERRGLDRALAALPRERRERVRIDPAGPDSTTHFAAADVYAHASYSESCPRVILEAMAHQLPILAAGVYGVVEQVQDKTNAYLVKPGDIDGFAAGLTRLLTDHGERCRIANAARQTFIDAAGFSSLIAAHTRLIERIAIE